MSVYDKKDKRKGIHQDAIGQNSRRFELIGKQETLLDSHALEC